MQLAKPDEISSTEKLLDHIRRDGSGSANGAVPVSSVSSRKAGSSFFPVFRLRKPVTIGVHIGESGLRLVKIRREGGGSVVISGFSTVSYKAPVFPDHEEFAKFLGSSIKDFCQTAEHCRIWSTLAPEGTAVRCLKLPNVSRKEIPNAAYWTFKKEAPFDEADSVFDYEILGQIMEDGVAKVEVLGCIAEKAEIARMRRLFESSGYPLRGLTTPAVGFLNFLKNGWVDTKGDNLCTLHIEKGSSRIDIFKSSGSLVLSRDIRTGSNSMLDAIAQGAQAAGAIEALKGIEFEVAEAAPEKPGIPPEGEKGSGPQDGIAHYISRMGEEAVFQLMLPALDRLTRQVERTLKHFSLNHNNESVNQVFISGEVGNFERFTRYMGDTLGIPIHRADPFMIAGDDVARPAQLSERIAYSTAAGAALCDDARSPNFLYSQKEKEKRTKVHRSGRLILYALVSLMIASLGYYVYQQRLIGQKTRRVEALSAQLKTFSPHVDKPDILGAMRAIGESRLKLQSLVKKYTGLALLSDLAHQVHPAVRLLHMELVIALKEPTRETKPEEKKNAAVKAPEQRLLKLEGIVTGSRANFESDLTEYLIGLKNSPLLSNPKVEKRAYEYFENEEVLRFTATLDVV